MAAPAKLIQIHTNTVVNAANWPHDSSAYQDQPYRWTVQFSVTPQSHSDSTTQTRYFYNGLDINVADWISNAIGGQAWKIISISSRTAGLVTCVVEDVIQFNTYNDPTTSGIGAPTALIDGFVFSMNTDQTIPLVGPLVPNILPYTWQTDMINRFNQPTGVKVPKLIKITVTSVTDGATWPSDGTTYAGRHYRWSVQFSVTPQSHSDITTQTHYYYNGLDVAANDWISNAAGGQAWKIISISSQTDSSVTCVVEDVNQLNTYSDPSRLGSGVIVAQTDGFVFAVNPDNSLPILVPTTPNVLPKTWQMDTVSRFNIPLSDSPSLVISDAVITTV